KRRITQSLDVGGAPLPFDGLQEFAALDTPDLFDVVEPSRCPNTFLVFVELRVDHQPNAIEYRQVCSVACVPHVDAFAVRLDSVSRGNETRPVSAESDLNESPVRNLYLGHHP